MPRRKRSEEEENVSELFKVSSNPHIRSKATTSQIMLAVIIALMPATGYGVYNFGIRALLVVLATIASTVLTEFLYGLFRKKNDSFRPLGGGDGTFAGAEYAG